MAHKTLIGGTAYEITGGRELISGTGYAKKSGRALINGTGYDISFAPKQYELRIRGTLLGAGSTMATGSYVEVNGTKYSSTAMVEVAAETSITVCAVNQVRGYETGNKITLNGEIVASGRPGSYAKHTYTPPKRTTVVTVTFTKNSAGGGGFYNDAAITTAE